MDLRVNPRWVAVLSPCVGWSETRGLLEALNAAESPFMTLAADQGIAPADRGELKAVLTSFVTLGYADLTRNSQPALRALADSLQVRLSELLQAASDELHRTLFLNVALELQPTRFHHRRVDGWSLVVLMAAYGPGEREARRTWRVALRALAAALTEGQRWPGNAER